MPTWPAAQDRAAEAKELARKALDDADELRQADTMPARRATLGGTPGCVAEEINVEPKLNLFVAAGLGGLTPNAWWRLHWRSSPSCWGRCGAAGWDGDAVGNKRRLN